MRKRTGMGIALLALLAVACATPKSGGDGEPAPFVAPSEAYALRPDGSVPWVDEQITDEQLYGPRPTRPPAAPGAKPCRADQLRGQLDTWWKPNPNAGEGPSARPNREPAKFIGEVHVTNVSPTECTLQGEVDTRLYSGETEVPMGYGHSINNEARARVTVVKPGGGAQQRLDWSGPFCAESYPPPFRLRIALPSNGGTLWAAVIPTDAPPCSRSELHPEYSAFLSSSGFDQTAATDPDREVRSPLSDLTVAIEGPPTARPGERLEYFVVFTNPTATAVPLEPCAGYYRELFSMGDATHQAVNTGTLFRLNCRAASQIPPGQQLRFQMLVDVPSTLEPGRSLSVSWGVRTRQSLQANLSTGYELTIA